MYTYVHMNQSAFAMDIGKEFELPTITRKNHLQRLNKVTYQEHLSHGQKSFILAIR